MKCCNTIEESICVAAATETYLIVQTDSMYS